MATTVSIDSLLAHFARRFCHADCNATALEVAPHTRYAVCSATGFFRIGVRMDPRALTAVAEMLTQNAKLAERIIALAEKEESKPHVVYVYPSLSPRQKRIVAVLREAGKPLKGEAIAGRLKLAFSKSLGAEFTQLQRNHVLIKTSDGYVMNPQYASEEATSGNISAAPSPN